MNLKERIQIMFSDFLRTVYESYAPQYNFIFNQLEHTSREYVILSHTRPQSTDTNIEIKYKLEKTNNL